MTFKLPVSLIADEAKKLASNIERRAGVKFEPAIKPLFIKNICGVLNGIELKNGRLTHIASEKNLVNIIGMKIVEKKQAPSYRKKWK